MIILGIDPGSVTTGYGLIEKKRGELTHIENGPIQAGDAPNFPERLVLIFEKIQQLIRSYAPEAMAIENIFYSKNVQSTLKLGHARGAALIAASTLKVPIFEYTPLAVKQAVVGYGGASKDQVQKMIKQLLKLPQVAEENASDALAIAVCHANSERMNKVLKMGER